MTARACTALVLTALLAAGCTSAQPSVWLPPPIPTHTPIARSTTRTTTPAPTPSYVAAPAKPAPSAMPKAQAVAVIPRSTYTNQAPIDKRLDLMGRITCITVHHEGDTNLLNNPQVVKLHMQDIRKVHVQDRGYGDIAYHFLIDPQGNIWEGRPLRYQGAHAGNSNANCGNIGICLMGDFQSTQPTYAQKAALQRLLVKEMADYNIPVSRVYTHQEVKKKFGLAPTDCPGRYLQTYMDELRGQWKTASR